MKKKVLYDRRKKENRTKNVKKKTGEIYRIIAEAGCIGGHRCG